MAPTLLNRDPQSQSQPTQGSTPDFTTADPSTETESPMMSNVATVLVVLMLAGLFVTSGLFMLRMRRRRLAALRLAHKLHGPPLSPNAYSHHDANAQRNMGLCAPARPNGHRRTKSLTTPPDSPVFVVAETDSLMDEKRWEAEQLGHNYSDPRRESIVPKIHLTFPEELDEKTGRRESKVVVVTVSDKGAVGLEPVHQQPPAYAERADMMSLDLDRIGGLKEKK